MLPRVPLDELEEDPLDPFLNVRYRGEPFTGVGFDETDEWISEYRYQDGRGHGRCLTVFTTGQKSEEFWLEGGRHTGESRAWYPTGRLKRYQAHERPRVERFWAPDGVLLEEVDEEHDLRRLWYPSGMLKRETRGETSRVFTRSGVLAWLRDRPARRAHLGEGLLFVTPVVEAELDALAVDPDLELELLVFVHQQLDTRPEPGLGIVARLLAHEDLWVRGTAIQIVGARQLAALRAALAVHVDDPRAPPPRWNEQTQRGYSERPIGEQARRALDALDARR